MLVLDRESVQIGKPARGRGDSSITLTFAAALVFFQVACSRVAISDLRGEHYEYLALNVNTKLSNDVDLDI